MGSGLIYAAVIGLWALVLLPMWLRTHDQSDEGKQVDRFKHAMASLGKSHYELIEQSNHRQVSAKRAMKAGAEVRDRMTPAARRRRALAVLVVLQIVALLAGLVGLPATFVSAPSLLIVGFLMLARTQVRLEQQRRDATRPQEQRPSKARAERNSFLRSLAAGRSAYRSSDDVEQAPAAPIVATTDMTASWQPVQTVAPSYVNAPAATAVPRAIDADGGWTGAAMVEAAKALTDAGEAEPAVESMEVTFEPTVVDPDATTEIPVIRIIA